MGVRKRRWGRKIFLFFVVCACGFSWFSITSSSALDKAIKKTRLLGVPLTPGDLRTNPPIPAAENAAKDYQAAFKVLEEQRPAVDAITNDLGGMTQPKDVPLGQAHAALRPLFPLIQSATSKPKVDFDRQWELGPNLLLPEYANYKVLAKMLLARSGLQARHGQVTQGWESLREAAVIGRHAGSEPILIGLLVRIAIESIVCRGVSDLLVNHHNEASLLAATRVLNEMEPNPDYFHALGSEVVMSHVTLDDPNIAVHMIDGFRSEQEMSFFDKMFVLSLRVPAIRHQYEANVLTHYNKLFGQLKPGPSDWRQVNKALKQMDQDILAEKSLAGTYSRILFPVFSQAGMALANGLAQKNALRVLIATLRERNRTGMWPSKAVHGTDDLDPFTDQPMVYKVLPDQVMVYSVGYDLKDDGGRKRSSVRTSGSESFDIGVTFPRKEPSARSPGTSRG